MPTTNEDDTSRFSTHFICESQLSYNHEHISHMEDVAKIRGWEKGRAYHERVRGLKMEREYWLILRAVMSAKMWGKPREVRFNLQKLKDYIGPEKYKQGWKPMMLEEYKGIRLPKQKEHTEGKQP